MSTTHIGSLTSYVALCGHIWNYDCSLFDLSQIEQARDLIDCPKCIDLLKKREALQCPKCGYLVTPLQRELAVADFDCSRCKEKKLSDYGTVIL